MRQFIVLVTVALFSSLFSIFLFKFFVGTDKVVIEDNGAGFVGLPVASKQSHRNIAALPDFSGVVPTVTNTVVTVKALSKADSYFWQQSDVATSSGSGVIISPDGFIITNHHVIEDALTFEITMSSGKVYEASLVGIDQATDLAVLKIDANQQLPYLAFGDSDSLFIGEWVMAVGNPFNLESTVTAGIVSAKSRSINILEDKYSIESFIQTDAAVNPGNSGGALVDGKGLLIGINTAIVTRSGKFDGYSFAVPSNLVKKVSEDLIEYGMVQRGILGVSVAKISQDLVEEPFYENLQGVLITSVYTNSSADNAKIAKGDIIIAINGKPTTSISKLQELIGLYRPGDALTVALIRDGKQLFKKVILQAPKSELIDKKELLSKIGFDLRDMKFSEKAAHPDGGVVVDKIFRGSKIAKSNMDIGFIITKCNDLPVTSKEELMDILQTTKSKILLEGFYPKYSGQYYYQFDNF